MLFSWAYGKEKIRGAERNLPDFFGLCPTSPPPPSPKKFRSVYHFRGPKIFPDLQNFSEHQTPFPYITKLMIFVFDVTIYSYTLRLFKIDPVVSVLPATNRQYFILALSLPLRWLRVTFVLNTLIALKELFFRPSDIAKRLRINVLVIL